MRHVIAYIVLLGSFASTAQAGVYISPASADEGPEYAPTPEYVEVVPAIRDKANESGDNKSVDALRRRSSATPLSDKEAAALLEMASPGGVHRQVYERQAETSGESNRATANSAKPDPMPSALSTATNIPLRAALDLLTAGEGWTINISKDVNESTPVSWSDMADREAIFERLANHDGFVMKVNADEKVIGISNLKAFAELLAMRNADIDGVNESIDLGVPADTYAFTPGTEDRPVRVWTYNGKETVNENFVRWAEKAGYTPVWSHPHDYTSDASAQYVGTFHEVVKRLGNALAKNGFPIGPRIRNGNNVLQIISIK